LKIIQICQFRTILMVRLSVIALACLLAASSFCGAAEFTSPNGKVKAEVLSLNERNCEARIVIRRGDRLLAGTSFQSADHEHGMCVDLAKWTADSRFFVFSLYSSGGHQPWHAPIMFFSMRFGRILALEHFLKDPITDTKFGLSPPNIVEFTTGTDTPLLRKIRLDTLNLVSPK